MHRARWSSGLFVGMCIWFGMGWCSSHETHIPSKTNEETAIIGTWNIEWLGNTERRADQPDPDDLAKYIIQSGVDVLCLNEITYNTETSEGHGNRTLVETLQLVSERTQMQWKHVLFPKLKEGDPDQHVGVAWNSSRVTRQGDPWRVPIRRGKERDIWQRHPYGFKLSFGQGKTDIVVVPLHMKSNRGGEDVTSKQRALEAQTLLRCLGEMQRHFDDDDLVLLGDTNVMKQSELTLPRITFNGFRDLNAGQHMTWIKSDRYPAAPFDRIFVPDDQPEFADSQLRVMRENHLGSEAAFRSKMSDHYMVTTTIRIMADDD